MEFYRIIKLLRTERGITQKKAADDLGVSQALLSHYEKGIRECGLDFVVRAADYYNVSCDYLLGRSADRNGLMLSADEIPNPDAMRGDSVYRGSVLPTIHKKLISNSLNILYAKAAKCGSRQLVSQLSAYLLLAVYQMFRLLYSAQGHNAPGLFRLSPLRWRGSTDAAMALARSEMAALLAGAPDDEGFRLESVSPLSMTTESLSREYPLYASSLFNLIKTAESRTEELLGQTPER